MSVCSFLRRVALPAAVIVLAACDGGSGRDDDNAAPQIPVARVPVVQTIDDLSADVTALAALPNASEPWKGRAVAALASGDWAFLALAEDRVVTLPAVQARSLVAAPDFQLRGEGAPLVLALSPQGVISVFLYLDQDEEEDPILLPMPADPIAPDIAAPTLLCPVRVTPALAEILVVSPQTAQLWTIRDTGGDALSTALTREAPEYAGALACAAAEGRGVTVLNADGILGNGFVRGQAVVTIAAGADTVALIAQDAGIAATEADTGVYLFDVEFVGAINTAGVDAAAHLALSSANYGGSYSDGVLLAASGDSVAVLSAGGVSAALRAALMNVGSDG